jgi:hypothetical protein
MPVKELRKPVKQELNQSQEMEEKVQKFISQGGSLAISFDKPDSEDHRLTLRIPKWLLDKVDAKRKSRVGTISRNLWILEQIEKATLE